VAGGRRRRGQRGGRRRRGISGGGIDHARRNGRRIQLGGGAFQPGAQLWRVDGVAHGHVAHLLRQPDRLAHGDVDKLPAAQIAPGVGDHLFKIDPKVEVVGVEFEQAVLKVHADQLMVDRVEVGANLVDCLHAGDIDATQPHPRRNRRGDALVVAVEREERQHYDQEQREVDEAGGRETAATHRRESNAKPESCIGKRE
jgi:hypothetical protein